jgi:Tol biopolymer transport system component
MFNRQPAKHGVPTHKQLTFVGDASFPAISPDGQFIAYVTGKYGPGQKVVVQDLIGGQPLEVYQADRCEYPRWSPDGAEFVFSANWQVTLLPRLGGNARNLGRPPYPLVLICSHTPVSNFPSFITIRSHGRVRHTWISGNLSWVTSLDWSPLGNRSVSHVSPEGYAI